MNRVTAIPSTATPGAAPLPPVQTFAPESLLRAQGVRALALAHAPTHPLDAFGLRLLADHGVAVRVGALAPAPLASWLQLQGLDWAQLAAWGHDWPDLPVLQRAGYSAAAADAHVEVRARVGHVCAQRHSDGALRELCDLLLTAHAAYADALAAHAMDAPARAATEPRSAA